MNNKWSLNLRRPQLGVSTRVLRLVTLIGSGAVAFAISGADPAIAANAPAWMHAQVGVSLPAHDEKTDAVLLYSETVLTVQPNGSIKRLQRNAYKILRPDGERFATV